jgi:hypothetical protein
MTPLEEQPISGSRRQAAVSNLFIQAWVGTRIRCYWIISERRVDWLSQRVQMPKESCSFSVRSRDHIH